MKCQLRILYQHRTQGRGAEGAHIRGMIDGFRALDHEVDITGPPSVDLYGTSSSTQQQPAASIGFLKKILMTFAEYAPQIIFELAEIAYNIRTHLVVTKLLATKRYDFVYERYALNSFATSKACSQHRVPLVIEVNDATVIERSRPLILKSVARRYENEVLMSAALIITISNKFRDLLVQEHGISQEKILVLPNAVDYSKFVIDHSCRFTRADAGVPPDMIVVGCAGHFVNWHGLKFLIRSLAGVARSYNMFVLLVGDGPVRVEVEELAAELGIADLVHFTGLVAPVEVPRYLKLMDICVIPDSNIHGSPMKLFEFMAMGKPVVLPRYQPLLDTLADGQEALFFDPRDGDGLRSALLSLVLSPVLREKLGARGLKKLFVSHTWSNHCSKVLKAFSLHQRAEEMKLRHDI